MSTRRALPLGVTASGEGTVSVQGPALTWLRRLDSTIVRAARNWGASEVSFPPIISAADLGRADYFRSFPHLMTVPVSLSPEDAPLQRFRSAYDEHAPLPMEEHAPVEHALLPAACFQVYPSLASTRLVAASLVTTRATCFRRESHFEPLRRQWAFAMREIVCVGGCAEVSGLLERGQTLITSLCDAMGLRHDRAAATDPFFQPTTQGRYLYQRLNPVKHETIVDDLAVASTNRHHEHFGDAFAITRDSAPAQSGCVAFGLERWLSVVCERWGADPEAWPDPRQAVPSHV